MDSKVRELIEAIWAYRGAVHDLLKILPDADREDEDEANAVFGNAGIALTRAITSVEAEQTATCAQPEERCVWIMKRFSAIGEHGFPSCCDEVATGRDCKVFKVCPFCGKRIEVKNG